MSRAHAILVIDDEPALRRSLALILQREGYRVTMAASALEARHCLQAGAYDLAFLDLKMPEMDGLTFLREIHLHHAEMPVLILTAHASLESAIEAVRQGARDYLLKPIKPAVLLARVREVLSEQVGPRRRREIASQINELVDELQSLDGQPAPSASRASGASAFPATESARYLRRGELTLDLHTRQAILRERHVLLPPLTFDYLVTLARHAPDAVSYETLVEESQGFRVSRAEARELAQGRVHNLRRKLELDIRRPEFIVTVRDMGYRLVVGRDPLVQPPVPPAPVK